ncbi:MAG: DUF3800 domain-containing protein [bacterium]|nr:DUF3800 domain-containing protein [bacterium]
MFIAYIDESGFSSQVDTKQPFYVLSAVIISSKYLKAMNNKLREEVSKFEIEMNFSAKSLGLGSEIKAKNCISMLKRERKALASEFAQCILNAPNLYSGAVINIIIDKSEYNKRGVLNKKKVEFKAIELLFERLSKYTSYHSTDDNDNQCICIHDENKILSDEMQSEASQLRKIGNFVTYWNEIKGSSTTTHNSLNNIADFAYSDSKNSLGIIIADFFASFLYQIITKNMEITDGIIRSLYNSCDKSRRNGVINGFGIKIYPESSQLLLPFELRKNRHFQLS